MHVRGGGVLKVKEGGVQSGQALCGHSPPELARQSERLSWSVAGASRAPSSSPATRTPIRRTGRRGASRSSRSRATAPTVRRSLTRGLQRVRAGDRAEVVVAHLDADRPALALVPPQRGAELLGEAVKLSGSSWSRPRRSRSKVVSRDSDLAALATLQRAVVLEAGEATEPGAEAACRTAPRGARRAWPRGPAGS